MSDPMVAHSSLQITDMRVHEYYMVVLVCRNIGIYLQTNLVWLYITPREYSTEQFRHPLCQQNIRLYAWESSV